MCLNDDLRYRSKKMSGKMCRLPSLFQDEKLKQKLICIKVC